MLTTTLLPRVFTFKLNGQMITLEDPDPTWDADAVLNYYMPHYPILATATVSKPVVQEDKIVITFLPTVGDKG